MFVSSFRGKHNNIAHWSLRSLSEVDNILMKYLNKLDMCSRSI